MINISLQIIVKNRKYSDKLYGSVCFLTKLAEQCGVIEDLKIVFEYNESIVNDILTLAIFPYLTQMNCDRCYKWQNYTKTPSERKLTPSYITKITKKITTNHRMEFVKLRLERQPKLSFVACDSSTRSACGRCIAEIRWGYNKDNQKLKNTVEVVVYSLTTHEPIYYRTFSGNCIDIRTIRTIKVDLLSIHIKDIIFIFDRCYYSNNNIGDLIFDQIPFIMCSKKFTENVYEYISTIKYDKFCLP